MKKNLEKIVIAALAVSMLCGCGSAAAPAASKGYANDMVGAYEEEPMAYASEESVAYDYDGAYEEAAYEVDTSMEEGSTETTVTFAEGKKIIYQSNIVMETMTYSETYTRLLELIKKYGGYIEYENFDNEMRSYLQDNSGRGKLIISTNNLTLRIPSKNYSDFMQEGLTLGNVLNRNQSIEDKTSEYNTNKSYVDILNDEAEYLDKQLNVLEQELKEAQANDKHYDEIIENMKEIAQRKAEVEKELVPYKRTMDDIDEKVEYSTINMELREVNEYTIIEEEIEEETFGAKIEKAWNTALSDLKDIFQGIVLFLIYALPVIVVLAIIAAIAVVVVILVKRSHKAKLEKRLARQREYAAMNQVGNNQAKPMNAAPNANANVNAGVPNQGQDKPEEQK